MILMSIKQIAWDQILTNSEALRSLALKILENPELGYQEYYACQRLSESLEGFGFEVERNYKGLTTAFKASSSKTKGPRVALLAEYDALPGVGHGCGHNLIGPAAVGAAIGIAAVLNHVPGEVIVIGTPAEEYLGIEEGKVKLQKAGAFDDLDACLMMHPYWENQVLGKDLGFIAVDIEFFGKPAHAAADPWNGVNALDALLMAFNNINALRQHLPSDVRIHGIITDGGQAPNIIPTHSAAKFMLRAEAPEVLESVYEKFSACVMAGAMAAGAELKINRITTVHNTKVNFQLNKLIKENFKALGKTVLDAPREMMASSDFGNVSQVVPSAMFFADTHPKNLAWHTEVVAKESGSEKALESMIASAQVMAGIVIDLLIESENLDLMKKDFEVGDIND
jgi:amidohydrolase